MAQISPHGARHFHVPISIIYRAAILLLIAVVAATHGGDIASWIICGLTLTASLRSISVQLKVHSAGEVAIRNMFRSYRILPKDVIQIREEHLPLRFFLLGQGIRRNIVTLTLRSDKRIHVAASQTMTDGILRPYGSPLFGGTRTRLALEALQEWWGAPIADIPRGGIS